MLSAKPLREADRVYTILTEDLGLIRATALGVRKESSKLRGLLEPVSLVSISLVRGKEYWRATSVELIKRIDPRPEVLRPLALLDKLVQGEAHHPELFAAVERGLMEEGGVHHPGEDSKGEEHFVAEILFHLGYLNEKDLTLPKKELIKAINEGLEASNLKN